MNSIIFFVILSFLRISIIDSCAAEGCPDNITDPSLFKGKISYLYEEDDFSCVTRLIQSNSELRETSNFDVSDDSEDNESEQIEQVTDFLIRLCESVDKKSLFEHAYLVAQKVRSFMNVYQPSLIVGIGRSPFVFIDFLDNMLSVESYPGHTKLKHMAFSGSPDIWFPKRVYKMESNEITSTRLDVIFSYFDELGFSQAEHGIWFIDIMGYGGSKNSLFRLLREYFIRRNLTQPPIHFILVANFEQNVLDEKGFLFVETFIYYQNSRVLEFFPYNKFYGFFPMLIPSTPINCPADLVDILDDDRFATLCAPIQQYKPFLMEPGSEKWRSEPSKYYALFKQAMLGGIKYIREHPKVDRLDLTLAIFESLFDNEEWINVVSKKFEVEYPESLKSFQIDCHTKLNFIKYLFLNRH